MSNANPDRSNAIFQAAPYCIKLVASDGRLLDMNPAGLQVLGAQTREQILGASVYQLVVPEYHEVFRSALTSVCAGGQEKWEFEIVTLSGERRWMESSAVPLRDDSTGEAVALAMTTDVTEKKRSDERLRQLQDQL